jgi:hypothetical protein
VEVNEMGVATRSNHDIDGIEGRQDPPSGDLAKPTSEAVPLNDRRSVRGDDNAEARVTQRVAPPSDVEPWRASPLAGAEHSRQVGRAPEAPATGKPLSAQPPPCLEGSRTASCLRPFFRRRLRTARPHRVSIRARKPCFRMRRLLRGLYVGFMPNPSERDVS